MKKTIKNIWFWISIILAVTLLFFIERPSNQEYLDLKEEYDDLLVVNSNNKADMKSQETAFEQKLKVEEKKYERLKKEYEPYVKLSKLEAKKKAEILEQEQEKKKKEEELAKKKAEEEKKIAEREKEKKKEAEKKKGYNTGITFDQLARNPEVNLNKKVKFSGKVLQVMQGDFEYQLRLAIDGNYDQVIFLRIEKVLFEINRVLEDDYITIYGISDGLVEYKTVMGDTRSIPSITVEKHELNK